MYKTLSFDMGLSTLKADKTTSKNPFLLQGFLRRVCYYLSLTKSHISPARKRYKKQRKSPLSAQEGMLRQRQPASLLIKIESAGNIPVFFRNYWADIQEDEALFKDYWTNACLLVYQQSQISRQSARNKKPFGILSERFFTHKKGSFKSPLFLLIQLH